MLTSPDPLPQIKDWSLEGRQKFVKKHEQQIRLIISNVAEELSENTVSKVFRSIEEIPNEVIKRFLVQHLDPVKLPCQDIKIFTHLVFWISHKTGGRVKAQNSSFTGKRSTDNLEGGSFNGIDFIEKCAHTLSNLNSKVDPDLIGFWLEANKQLREVVCDEPCGLENKILAQVSDSQKTRYKADACFRFVYLHFKLGNNINISPQVALTDYESKYFQKGTNTPQYVHKGTEPESHQTKHEVRKLIAQLIELLAGMGSDLEKLEHALIKPAFKKALLDIYELDSSMKKTAQTHIETFKDTVPTS